VEAVDVEGRPVPTADNAVVFSVTGAGHIAALGSNNPRHTEAYRGDRHRLFRGRCLAIVQPSEQAGEISLRAEANGLRSAEMTISTRRRPEP